VRAERGAGRRAGWAERARGGSRAEKRAQSQSGRASGLKLAQAERPAWDSVRHWVKRR